MWFESGLWVCCFWLPLGKGFCAGQFQTVTSPGLPDRTTELYSWLLPVLDLEEACGDGLVVIQGWLPLEQFSKRPKAPLDLLPLASFPLGSTTARISLREQAKLFHLMLTVPLVTLPELGGVPGSQRV